MKQTMTKIILSDLDVIKFKLFLKHYDLFTTLIDSEALNQKSANIILSFNHDGILSLVRREDILFSKKFANQNKE